MQKLCVFSIFKNITPVLYIPEFVLQAGRSCWPVALGQRRQGSAFARILNCMKKKEWKMKKCNQNVRRECESGNCICSGTYLSQVPLFVQA